MKALLIPVDGPPREVNLPDPGGIRFMRALRTLIGTRCAERIQVTSRWEAWLDEDGAAAGKPANQAARCAVPVRTDQAAGRRPHGRSDYVSVTTESRD